MIERESKKISLRKQCYLLSLNRSSLYYSGVLMCEEESKIINEISEIWHEIPVYGYRRIWAELRRRGYKINRKRVQRLMKEAGLSAIYPGPKTSKGNPEHKIYPYLLKGMEINRPNQVWMTDLTYIKMPQGFIYLMAIIDVYSRKVIGWDIGNSMDLEFCLGVLKMAFAIGKPDILNTDQGSQYTSPQWIEAVEKMNVLVSMDGKGRWADNIMIERFWRTVKWEHLYLRSYETVREVKESIAEFIGFYNQRRVHQSLEYNTPEEIHAGHKKAPDVILGKPRASKSRGIPLDLEAEIPELLLVA